MAGAEKKRIVDLTETSEVQSGDYIAIDSTARGTKKTPVSVFAKAADLTAEQTARAAADTTLDGKITAEAQARAEAIEAEQTAREEADDALTESITALSDEVDEQGALIQNPTKTVSGAIAHFTDGADMPAKSVVVNIEPVQSGTGTPSPDNVRQISGWESVNVYVSPTEDEADGHTTTTSLGRTVYGGTLDVVSGVLTVTHEILDLGSLNWQYNSSYGSGGGAFYSTSKNFGYTDDSEAPNMTCSMYPVKSRNDLYSSADPAFGVTGSGTTRYATVRDTRYTDPTAFKTAMNGVQLAYPTNDPQTYQLTPTQINTLLGENNVWADAGAVSVTYRRDINLALEQLEALLNS